MGLFDRSRKGRKLLASSPADHHSSAPEPSGPTPTCALSPAAEQRPAPPASGGPFRPPASHAGGFPPPPQQGWNGPPGPGPGAPSPYPYPVVVNQHYYYMSPPPPPGSGGQRPYPTSGGIAKISLGSVANLASDLIGLPGYFNEVGPTWQPGTEVLTHGAAMYDQISSKFDNLMTKIDRDRYAGNEADPFTYQLPPPQTQTPPRPETQTHAKRGRNGAKDRPPPKDQSTAAAVSAVSGTYAAKVDLYANSRLPKNLPPLKLYVPTYPLLCLAAQYSERVYSRPEGAERNAHVDADWRTGTKAMFIKSVPMDYMNTIVFAIRGTATFMDWAVNLNMAPTSPAGFLDDPGNFCHTGFLSVARKMVKPVAQRLRQLLEEDPSRASSSLLITGHSAGGAVASLLYMHMLSTSPGAASELNSLTSCFRRVHCVTFGTPPVSLLPLTTPDRKDLRKSLFLTFVNEGDPVARADTAYVRSLLELFASPAPSAPPPPPPLPKSKSKASLASSKSSKSSFSSSSSSSGSSKRAKHPIWPVPPGTLSSPGRIAVLRSGDPRARRHKGTTVEDRLNEGVVAHVATDEQLRGVVWGDPVCHVMRLYAGRIETMAIGAITGKS